MCACDKMICYSQYSYQVIHVCVCVCVMLCLHNSIHYFPELNNIPAKYDITANAQMLHYLLLIQILCINFSSKYLIQYNKQLIQPLLLS